MARSKLEQLYSQPAERANTLTPSNCKAVPMQLNPVKAEHARIITFKKIWKFSKGTELFFCCSQLVLIVSLGKQISACYCDAEKGEFLFSFLPVQWQQNERLSSNLMWWRTESCSFPPGCLISTKISSKTSAFKNRGW